MSFVISGNPGGKDDAEEGLEEQVAVADVTPIVPGGENGSRGSSGKLSTFT